MRILLANSPDLTILSSNSFPGLLPENVILSGLENLETIESNFLQGGESGATQLAVFYCPKLRYDILIINL